MNTIAKALRLWRTVRWLKPVQIYGRVWFRVSRPKPDLRPAPSVRALHGVWVDPARREQSLIAPTQMRFLNEERDLDVHGWDDKALAKLWRYNQHYFDDLVAFDARKRVDWHRTLLTRWIAECPPGKGTAWEPYPTSLRMVNWIKWIRAGNAPVPGMLESLAVQTRWLTKRLEWHLLGNHLFVNAKALVMAGLFFEGQEADAWRETGWRILRAEIPEQILADGGQFERSPMYHALAVEDMLDLANAMRAAPSITRDDDVRRVIERIPAMCAFLASVCHPDGEVSFFNDSAQGIAPSLAELEAYARRLSLQLSSRSSSARLVRDGAPLITRHEATGFVRLESQDAVVILDAGPVGPDYLPGHAHADTLSFELSIAGERVLVNSGTSRYGVGPERLRERGTAAHNTVVVAGADSSEVWGGFRVARRARPGPTHTEVDEASRTAIVSASHDGYRRLRGGGDHVRTWEMSASGGLFVKDKALPWQEAESHWHFAPDFQLSISPDARTLRATGPRFTLEMLAEGAEWRVGRSTYSPRFGVSLPNQKAVARFLGPESTVRIVWSPCMSSS
jgi:uncharacterized heparinase superfamily protein